ARSRRRAQEKLPASRRSRRNWDAVVHNREPRDQRRGHLCDAEIRSRRGAREGLKEERQSLTGPLNPCATTYHSLESLRLAGGFACFTVSKWRLRSATRLLSAPPASTFATKEPPGFSTSFANSNAV